MDYEDDGDEEGLDDASELMEVEPAGPAPEGYRAALAFAVLLVLGALAWEFRQPLWVFLAK